MYIRCQIASFSHVVTEDCFRLFASGESSIRLTKLSVSSFAIEIDTAVYEEAGSECLEYHAHLAASCMLVALNIATLGYFTWLNHPTLHPVYEIRQSLDQQPVQVALYTEYIPTIPLERTLTDVDVENAVILFLPLVQDRSLAARTEYIKGLLHLGIGHHDITFYREAFGNFYRSLENCVTQKILRVERLTNEVAQIKKALANVGADECLQEAFREVYVIRSSQVAHAQNEPMEVTFDDVLKVKAITDLLLAKTYRQIAEKIRQEKKHGV